MTVELKLETERLVQEEIRSGHIHSVDELIVLHHVHLPTAPVPPRKPRKI